MTQAIALDLRCADFLKDNHTLYAHKARRKKIALIRVEAVNSNSGEVRLRLAETQLLAGGTLHRAESPEVIIRKFSEFTWDFLVYLFLDFHPVLAALDVFFLLSGPFLNWRLKRQLRELSNSDLSLKPGERRQILLGFRGVAQPPEQLQLVIGCEDASSPQTVACAISA